jgi:hypothetical protein
VKIIGLIFNELQFFFHFAIVDNILTCIFVKPNGNKTTKIMEKLSNTKYQINVTLEAIKSCMKDDVSPEQFEFIEFMVSQVAISSARDCQNLMNEITNAISDLNKK